MRVSLSLLATLSLLLPPATAMAAGGGGSGDLNFVPLEEIRVPIIDGDRTNGTLALKLVLQVSDGEAADHATASLPTLRAAAVAEALEFARLYASPAMPVDAERLAAEMTAAVHRADAGVQRALVVEVVANRG